MADAAVETVKASQPGDSRIPKVGAAKDPNKRRSLLPAPKALTRPGSVSPPHSGDDSGKPKPKVFKKDTLTSPPARETPTSPRLRDTPKSPENPSTKEFKIGDHVTIAGVKPGVVKFYGSTHFGEGVFCGIELYDAEGKHDGMLDGVRYFSCSSGYGIFAPSHKVEYATTIPSKFAGTGSRLKAPASKLPGATSKWAASKSSELDIESDLTKDPHSINEPRPSRLPSKLIKPRALVRPTPVNKESFASHEDASAWKGHVGDGDARKLQKPSRLPLQDHAASKPASKQTNLPELPPLNSTYDVNDFKAAFSEAEDPNEIPVITTPSRVDPLVALTLAYDLENSSGSDSDRDQKQVNKTIDLKREAAKVISPTREVRPDACNQPGPSKKDGGASSEPEDDYEEDDFDNLDLMSASMISHASSLGILAEADICENNLITEDLDDFLSREDETSRDSDIDEKEIENEISGISTPDVDMSSSTLSGKEICSSPDFDVSPVAKHEPEALLDLTFDPNAVDTSTPAEPLKPALLKRDSPPTPADSEAGEKMASPTSSNSNSPEIIDKDKILLKNTTYILSKGDADDSCRILDSTENYPEEMHMTKSMEGPAVTEMNASMELAKTAVAQLADLMAGAETEKEVQHTKVMQASLETMDVSLTRELDVVPEENIIPEEEVPEQKEAVVTSPTDYSLGSQTEHHQLMTVVEENEQVLIDSEEAESKQLLDDLEAGHKRKERPVSTISTCSVDTGIGTEVLSPRIKDRPLSLISTTSTDTGYHADTDTEINTLAGSPDHSDVEISPRVYVGKPALDGEESTVGSTKTLEEAYMDSFHSYQRAVMQGTERERPKEDGSIDSDAVSNAGTLVADSSGTDHEDSDMECSASVAEPPVVPSEMPIEMAHVDFLDGLDVSMIGDKVPSAISEICPNPIVVMTTIPPPDNTVTMTTTTTHSVGDTSVTMATCPQQPECSSSSMEAMATLPDTGHAQVTPCPLNGASTSHTSQENKAATLSQQTIANQSESESESIERNIEMCMEAYSVEDTKDKLQEDLYANVEISAEEEEEEEGEEDLPEMLQTIEEDVCMSQSHYGVGHVCDKEEVVEVIEKVSIGQSESSCKMANGIGGLDKIEAERKKLESLADITCGNVSVEYVDHEMLEDGKLKKLKGDMDTETSGEPKIDVIDPKSKNSMHLLKIDVSGADMSESTIKDAGPGEKGIKVVDSGGEQSSEEKMEVENVKEDKTERKTVTKRKTNVLDSNKAAKSPTFGKGANTRLSKKPDASDKPDKKPVTKVGSRIMDNVKQTTTKAKGPEKTTITNPKTSKNVTNASNKKKAEGNSDKASGIKLNVRRASAPPSPRIDTGNTSARSTANKSAMSDIEESESAKKAVKRTTPRSKWDNITSSIDSGKDKKAKPTAKAEVKSRINTGMSSPRSNPSTASKTAAPTKTPTTNPTRRTSLAESRVKATGVASSRLRADARGDSRMSSASDISTQDTSRSNGLPSPRRPVSSAAKPGNRSATTLRRDRSSSTGSDSQLSSISQVSTQGSKQTPSRSSPPGSTSTTPRTPRLATKRQSVPAIEVTPSKISTADKRRASVGVPTRLALSPRGKKDATGPTPLSTSTPFKKPATSNVNRNKTAKPTATTPGTKRANQSNVSTAETTAEIARLEALCESRTKELTYAKMQLRAGITGFEAMAVLVNYMSTELDAFSCPAVTAGLREAQQNLQKAESQLRALEKEKDALQAELTTLRQQYEAEKARLTSQHKEQLETLEKRLKKDAEDQVQAVINKHSHEVTTLNNFHERNLKDMKKEYERKVAEKEEEQKKEIANIVKENEQNMAELQKQHETRLEEFTMRFENIKMQLSEKVEMLRGEGEELRMREKTYMEKCQRDSDLKIQMSIAPYRHLPAEIESLTSVLDMRNQEIHDLRRQQLDLEKQLEEVPKARDQIRALQQKVENLEAIISIKAEYERQLSEKHQKLLRKLDKESKTNKRLSMDNDELSWRLSAAADIGPGGDIMRRSLTHSPPGSATSTPVIMRRSLQHSPPARENNNFNIMSTSAPVPVQMRRKKSPRSPCETTFSFDQSPIADEGGSPPKTNLKRSGTYDLLDREDLDCERDHELRQSES